MGRSNQAALESPVTAWTSIDQATDEELMARYVANDHAALAILVQRYERELYSYLKRVVVDPALAEDVFQNTFMQLHQKRGLYEAGRPVRPWLYTIATHQAIDAMRRHKRHRRVRLATDSEARDEAGNRGLLDSVESEMIDPHDHCERNERARIVRETVDSLTEHLRMVVVLGYYQGLKYREIADILGIPVGTVKSRLHAAVQKLGEVWKARNLTAE